MDGHDHDYPAREWSVEGLAAAIEPGDDLPRYGDAGTWAAVADDPLLDPYAREIRELAATAAGEPIPPLPASAYARHYRTGERGPWSDPFEARRRRIVALALAECFEREGDYLDPVLDHAWAICEQATWNVPAHLPERARTGDLPEPGDAPTVALRSADTGHLLAELDYLLGDRLHPALRERVRHEVDRRLFEPFLTGTYWWNEAPANNWNPVCNGSVLMAALRLCEEPDRRARIVRQAAADMGAFLADFGPDGGSSEGVGYWSFGVGHYVQAAALLAAATDGAYSLFEPPIVREIARYPVRVELSPGRSVPFSDCREARGVSPYLACELGRRLEMPDLLARGRATLERATLDSLSEGLRKSGLPELLRTFAWGRGLDGDGDARPAPPARSYLPDLAWWVCRASPADPDGLVLAAKGGHNDEDHNHDDLGSFVVHAGRESLLSDPGQPADTREYFGDGRYDALAARSLGHSVPHVNGCEQAPGREYAATVLECEGDRFALELAGAYPEAAGLASLRRTFELHREDRRVTVADEARFEPGAGTGYESVLVSYAPIEATGDGLRVTGERASATVTADRPVSVDVEELTDHRLHDGDRLRRARLAPDDDGRTVALTLTVDPTLD